VVINISYGNFFLFLSLYVNSATSNFMGMSRIPLKTKFHGENIYQFCSCPTVNPHSLHYIKNSQLMLYSEIIAVCSEIHTKHTSTLCGQNVELWMLNWWYIQWPLGLNVVMTLTLQTALIPVRTQSVPRSKHTPSRL